MRPLHRRFTPPPHFSAMVENRGGGVGALLEWSKGDFDSEIFGAAAVENLSFPIEKLCGGESAPFDTNISCQRRMIVMSSYSIIMAI